ncbi:MAG: UDP-N-acetylglucosamine--N-acetylmuramyl-(pentapeptide) pyrophosphoryl-undecaprenol N-acetylglucosamine transferase [Planctomycetes bacterium]|nr:UDP-N-acetylglucosamine--N-acetylmuramyl-(pentapeptide) pyrophosphoryl-undecaprenol N-acetylglucosamine transferase [Planctomycetota bacterium]
MPKSSGILFCGGGTGGHVLPGLAVAEALRVRGERAFRWIGDPARIEATLVPKAGITLLPYGLSRPRPYSPRWLLASLYQAWGCFRELRRSPPRVVVALGGYAALLPGLLAPLLGRPLLVMEQNARSGRTNRLLARFANAVVTQFPEACRGLPAGRVSQLGNPVRAITPRDRGQGEHLTVLVAGGSLAASTLNDLVVQAATSLSEMKTLRIIHLAGEKDQARVAEQYRAAGISAEVMGFCHDMPALYERIDVAITRAGATTVAELCAAGIPALYIPLPWAADDHQTANAQAVTRVGGAEVLPQATTTPAHLATRLRTLVEDRVLVARMGRAALALARPQAAAEVAALVEGLDRRVSRRVAGDRRAASRRRYLRSLIGKRRVRA